MGGLDHGLGRAGRRLATQRRRGTEKRWEDGKKMKRLRSEDLSYRVNGGRSRSLGALDDTAFSWAILLG
jgi:hypothetical protein